MTVLPFLNRQSRHDRRELILPGPRDRMMVNGMTGQGKSTFMFWVMSEAADFDKKPWVIVDYKKDPLVREMLTAKDANMIGLRDDIPDKPGIYVLYPEAATDQMDVVRWMWAVYQRGKCGIIFDEIAMVPELRGEANSGGPLKSILTQGRSKEIPVYAATQRPIDVSKYVYTEAQYISVFRLKSRKDREKVLEYIPDDDPTFTSEERLPDHWSRWWDDKRGIALVLKPCPDGRHILDSIASRVYHSRRHAVL